MTNLMDYITLLDSMETIFKESRNLDDGASHLSAIGKEMDKPINLMIIGEFNAGKSTLINTLIGEGRLRSDVVPTTAAVTKLVYGETTGFQLVFKDGTIKEHHLDEFDIISAELDEKGGKIRQELSHIQMQYPAELLKRINLIDTPGLNSAFEKHTEATNDFFDKADIAFWMFELSQTGSFTELEMLEKLSSYVKPIGIINYLDEMDEDDTLEGIIEDAATRLDPHITEFVGISALQAFEALADGDTDLLEESQWPVFLEMLEKQIEGEHIQERKQIRILLELEKVFYSTKQIVDGFLESSNEIVNQMEGNENYKETLKKEIDSLQKTVETWAGLAKMDSYYMFTNIPWPLPSLQDEALRGTWEEQLYYMEELKGKASLLEMESEHIAAEGRNLDARISRLRQDWIDYESSGLFGNEPLIFTGRKKVLEREQVQLNQDIQTLNTLQYEYESRVKIHEELKLAGLNDLRGIAHMVATRLKAELKGKIDQYNDKNYLIVAKETLQQSEWIPEFTNRLKREILPQFQAMHEENVSKAVNEQLISQSGKCLALIEGMKENTLTPIRYNSIIQKINEGLKTKDLSIPKIKAKAPSRLQRRKKRMSFGWGWLKPVAGVAIIVLLVIVAMQYGGGLVTTVMGLWDEPEEIEAIEIPTTYHVSVLTDGANIRQSPSLEADIVTAVPKGEILLVYNSITDHEGREWLNIELSSGKTGWVSSKIVERVE